MYVIPTILTQYLATNTYPINYTTESQSEWDYMMHAPSYH